jgi:hypothetical protein
MADAGGADHLPDVIPFAHLRGWQFVVTHVYDGEFPDC